MPLIKERTINLELAAGYAKKSTQNLGDLRAIASEIPNDSKRNLCKKIVEELVQNAGQEQGAIIEIFIMPKDQTDEKSLGCYTVNKPNTDRGTSTGFSVQTDPTLGFKVLGDRATITDEITSVVLKNWNEFLRFDIAKEI